MSLFEEYPPLPRKAPKLQRDDCCDAWAAFIARTEGDGHRVWDFVHRWGHRRTPFSADALAEIAGTSRAHAEAVIGCVVELGWVAPIQPEYYQRVADRLWAGRLSKER
jgi:hypothetical protein